MRIGIGTRLRLNLALIVAIVLILGAFGYRAMTGLAGLVKGSLADAVRSTATIDEMRLVAREARFVVTASAGAATTSDLKRLDALQEGFEERLADLAAKRAGGFDGAELSRLFSETASAGKAFANANAAQQWAKAADLSVRFEKSDNELEQRLASASSEQRARVDRQLTAASEDLRKKALLFAAGIAACLLVGAVLDFSLRRRLVAPLVALTKATARIVEFGDLAQKIEVRAGDEIGDLAASFQQLVEKLRQIPSSLRQATDVLTTSVENLGNSASQQVEAVTRHAAAVQETSVTANEIRQTSASATERAETLLQAVSRADQVREAGESSVQRTLASLGDIASSVTSTAERIALLKERMRQIDAINLAVKDLADQSNMLALNAAIEAVRSGEHGKGFGVVAREIRSLADQSIQATGRVREILDDISHAIEDAAKISVTARRKAEVGLSEAQSSGETLRELSVMVMSSVDGVRQIAQTMTEQNAGIGQIFTAVNDLIGLMEDTRKQVDSTEQAIGSLRDVAARVSGIVNSYRV